MNLPWTLYSEQWHLPWPLRKNFRLRNQNLWLGQLWPAGVAWHLWKNVSPALWPWYRNLSLFQLNRWHVMWLVLDWQPMTICNNVKTRRCYWYCLNLAMCNPLFVTMTIFFMFCNVVWICDLELVNMWPWLMSFNIRLLWLELDLCLIMFQFILWKWDSFTFVVEWLTTVISVDWSQLWVYEACRYSYDRV